MPAAAPAPSPPPRTRNCCPWHGYNKHAYYWQVSQENPPRHLPGRGTARSAVEGFYGVRRTPPPCFAWSPSPANAGEEFHALLIPQRMDRVRPRHPDGVAGDGAQRDRQREAAGEHERRRPKRDAAVEAVQPVAHHPPRHRPGDQIGDDHRLGELPGEQPDDVARAGAEHLADADLLRPPLGG